MPRGLGTSLEKEGALGILLEFAPSAVYKKWLLAAATMGVGRGRERLFHKVGHP